MCIGACDLTRACHTKGHGYSTSNLRVAHRILLRCHELHESSRAIASPVVSATVHLYNIQELIFDIDIQESCGTSPGYPDYIS